MGSQNRGSLYGFPNVNISSYGVLIRADTSPAATRQCYSSGNNAALVYSSRVTSARFLNFPSLSLLAHLQKRTSTKLCDLGLCLMVNRPSIK